MKGDAAIRRRLRAKIKARRKALPYDQLEYRFEQVRRYIEATHSLLSFGRALTPIESLSTEYAVMGVASAWLAKALRNYDS
jgi:hypothetical protein